MEVRELPGMIAPQAAHDVAGRLDAQLTVTGAGATREAMSRSLRGQGTFSVDDGALRGVNVAERVLGA
jgi:uncharacterized protein involved in outer membrane biogenesis